MNKAERDNLEKDLTEQLGIKVIIDEYAPKGAVLIFNFKGNSCWTDEEKQWVVLPADEDSIKSVSEAVKSVIIRNLNEMEQIPNPEGDQLLRDVTLPSERVKSTD
jgi:hypothetical protein